MRIALLAAALLTCGGHVEQRSDAVMGGWIIQVGGTTGTMVVVTQGKGACGFFRLGQASGWVYNFEAEVLERGISARFELGAGYLVTSFYDMSSGRFSGTAWRDDAEIEIGGEDFNAYRPGGGGGAGHPATP